MRVGLLRQTAGQWRWPMKFKCATWWFCRWENMRWQSSGEKKQQQLTKTSHDFCQWTPKAHKDLYPLDIKKEMLCCKTRGSEESTKFRDTTTCVTFIQPTDSRRTQGTDVHSFQTLHSLSPLVPLVVSRTITFTLREWRWRQKVWAAGTCTVVTNNSSPTSLER